MKTDVRLSTKFLTTQNAFGVRAEPQRGAEDLSVSGCERGREEQGAEQEQRGQGPHKPDLVKGWSRWSW
jgi:hypothetical protein